MTIVNRFKEDELANKDVRMKMWEFAILVRMLQDHTDIIRDYDLIRSSEIYDCMNEGAIILKRVLADASH